MNSLRKGIRAAAAAMVALKQGYILIDGFSREGHSASQQDISSWTPLDEHSLDGTQDPLPDEDGSAIQASAAPHQTSRITQQATMLDENVTLNVCTK